MLLLVATGINLCAAEDDVMAEPVAKSSGKEIAVSKRYSYPAPNFKNGSRLLFQGDSITDMGRDRNPESKDRNHYLGHSCVFLLAARLGVEMPDAQLDFINRGISGNTVGDLRQRWEKDALDVKPDVLTILIGTNNIGHNKGLDNVLYHGRILTIIWDKTGEKYKRGQGLTVFADGKKIAQSATLSRVSGKL